MSQPVHVIGAGLAGLAAACMLAECGREVVLQDAAKAAGGRARSYRDKTLKATIDNGNHLLLSGNTAAMVYLRRIGSIHSLTGPAKAIFPFANIATGARWTVRLDDGRMPWWIFDKKRRVPDSKLLDYFSLLKLRNAQPYQLVGPLLGGAHGLYSNFLEPVAIAALNTMPDVAATAPLRAVFAETIERGGLACIPRYAQVGLSESFVDPALDWLRDRGVQIRLGKRVTSIDPSMPTVLAVPPWVAAKFLPELAVPDEFESICNLHFKYRLDPGEAGFWGLVGGMAEWVFAKGEILSVTVSAANRYAEMDPDALAEKIWAELAAVFALPAKMPVHRLVWEKRATFSCTAAQLAKRPKTETPNPNLVLAGDWTDTGLPASIEGAIRSGNAAALALLNQDRFAPALTKGFLN